jgi:8-oxo-dGTP pyrophosphatase MutT (NUDIX family)
MEKAKPRVLSEWTKFKGQWLEVKGIKVDLGNGNIVDWEKLEMGDCVGVVAVDEKNNFFLGKEWRPQHNKYIYQIAAGDAERKTSEKELSEEARRELREEFGVDARKMEKLATVVTGGRIKEKWHFYLAKDLFDNPLKRDENESIEVFKLPINEAYSFLLSHDCHFSALLGVLLAKEKLGL